MKIYSEKEAEEFLKKQGFEIVENQFIRGEKQLDEFLKKAEYPIVMKSSGKKIIHKRRVSGVKIGILNYSSAIASFEELMKIENTDEVLIQKQLSGKEFLLGIKKTPEFGQVIVFGAGGSLVEEKKDIEFRVCPLEKKEIVEMVEDTEVGKSLSSKEKEIVVDDLIKLCSLADKFPEIKELDINPLILTENYHGVIVDARISWE